MYKESASHPKIDPDRYRMIPHDPKGHAVSRMTLQPSQQPAHCSFWPQWRRSTRETADQWGSGAVSVVKLEFVRVLRRHPHVALRLLHGAQHRLLLADVRQQRLLVLEPRSERLSSPGGTC